MRRKSHCVYWITQFRLPSDLCLGMAYSALFAWFAVTFLPRLAREEQVGGGEMV